MSELGFDVASDLLVCLRAERAEDKALEVPLPTLLVTPRAFTPRALPTSRALPLTPPRADAFLRSLPYSVTDVLTRARAAGYVMEIRHGEKPPAAFYAWKVRLAVEERRVRPAPIETVALPANTDVVTRAVWDGFVFLLGCKRLSLLALGSTYTREFAGPWSGVTVKQAREAITALSRMRYLIDSGEKSGRATIWLPRGASVP
jgi:hypothetical protein